MAAVLGGLGHLDQALKRIHEALTLAQKLSHPFSLAWALNWAAILHHFRREGQAVQEQAEALIALSSEQGFPLFATTGTVLRGWALAEQGQVEEGITQMRQGLAGYRATGAELTRPYFLLLLAEAHAKAGQAEEGLTVVVEALDLVEHEAGTRRGEAELYRLKGQLTLKQSGVRSPQHPAPNTQHPRSRSVFSESHRHCPPPECEVPRAAGGDEPETAVAAAGQEGRSPKAAGGDLRLVH